MKASAIFAAIAALLVSAATAQECPGNWTLRADSCYNWFPDPRYWFDAEQVCRSHRGHLVSVGSENENTLAARLAQCRDVWIGRFGTKLKQLNDPSSYEWTDGSDAVSFHRHNFSRLDTVHKPLIRSDGEWWLNSLYHERHPFVCERSANATTTSRCPNGWTLFNNHCYLMPEFESNFNEANFYCQRKSSQLVSVLSESELRHMNKLTFGIGACRNPLDTVWIGLIKLNPCFPDSGGRELCYQWTDFSGKHLGFPKWHAGHPNKEDWTVNCVTLTGDGLRSDRCHSRHRFVCKSAAGNDTDGGGGSVDGVVAAFDFRKGLTNLVNPRTYVVRDDFGVPRTQADGACFKLNSTDYYWIGQPMNYDESLLGQTEWTLFVRSWVERDFGFCFMTLNQPGYNESVWDSEFYAYHRAAASYTYLGTLHSEYPESAQNSTAAWGHNNYHIIYNTSCSGTWCSLAISMDNSRAVLRVNEKSAAAEYQNWTVSRQQPETLEMALGNLYSAPYPLRFCVSCFGIAHKQLSSLELQQAFATYCP